MRIQGLNAWIVCLTCGLAVGCSVFPNAARGDSHAEHEMSVSQLASNSVSHAAATSDNAVATDTNGSAAAPAESDRTAPAVSSPASAEDRPVPAGSLARCLNFSDDWNELPREFFRDIESIWTRENGLVLLVAGGASYLSHETLDDDVANNTRRHKNRWGKGGEFFAGIGNPGHHFAAIGALYLYSLHTQDAETHDLSKTLFNAVSVTGLSTIFLKATIGSNTNAPNQEPDPFIGAWPSGHTSSSFAVAAVLDEYYGPKVGVPAYLLAGLAGWERIDDREHDLSDVIFGAALGYVIGKTVAGEHRTRFWGMELQPHFDTVTGSSGLALERRF